MGRRISQKVAQAQRKKLRKSVSGRNLESRAGKRVRREALWERAVTIARERVEEPLESYVSRIYHSLKRRKQK